MTHSANNQEPSSVFGYLLHRIEDRLKAMELEAMVSHITEDHRAYLIRTRLDQVEEDLRQTPITGKSFLVEAIFLSLKHISTHRPDKIQELVVLSAAAREMIRDYLIPAVETDAAEGAQKEEEQCQSTS